MSKYVSKKDKFLRVFGFSAYISAVLAVLAAIFIDVSTAVYIFIISFVYFLVIFLVLVKTKNIHFNILIKHHHLKKVIYQVPHRLIDMPASAVFFWIGTAILGLAVVFFTIKENFVFVFMLVALLIMNYAYFYKHTIMVYLTKQGLAVDYGHWITLTRWNEFKSFEIKGRHARFCLKEKNVHRWIPVDHPKKFRQVVKKFVKAA